MKQNDDLTNREVVQLGNEMKEDGEKCVSCRAIQDHDRYVLNPLCRLRNRRNYVLLYGVEGNVYNLHRTTAIILALCNGSHTVADIAHFTRPFVKIANEEQAEETARHEVKQIIYQMRQTKEEQAGQPPLPSVYPSAAPLVAKGEYESKFHDTGLRLPDYNPRDFLPKDASEIANGPVHERHEPAPVRLAWHFTSECSTDCKYCYLGRRKNLKLLSIERVLSLIEEAVELGVVQIDPLGGDVLLYPHLKQVLDALSKYNLLPILLSTKSFLSKEKAAMLAEKKGLVWKLQFSIDSTIPDVADYLTGTKNFTQRIFSSIDNALEAGLPVGAKAVVTPYNILTIPQLYRDLKERGVKQILLATYSRSGFHHSDDLFNCPASYQWLEQQFKQLRKEFPDDEIHCQNGGPAFEGQARAGEAKQEAWKKASACTAGRSIMLICADGKVIPCEQMPETEEFFCGDVSHQSIQEVWDGDRLRELTYGPPRERFQGTSCYDCEEFEECVHRGVCIRDLSMYYGNIYQPPDNCPKSKQPFLRQT
jgi:radical SAM protein with 4Fe4S-binding SPASM domain